MYSAYYNLAPKPICDLFTRNTAHHSTRKSLNLDVPRFNYSIGRNSIRKRGSTLWNTLPKSYQAIHKLEHFKEQLKKDTKLLEKIDFLKESCMLSNKDVNFYYLRADTVCIIYSLVIYSFIYLFIYFRTLL